MKIIFTKEYCEIISDIKEIGSLKSDNLLITAFAKILWENPENKNKKDKITKEGRILEFDHPLEVDSWTPI
jgi:hypothetical protein